MDRGSSSITMVGDHIAEATLVEACVVCGGDLQLRISRHGARTFCAICHLIARPRIEWLEDGMRLSPGSPAKA